MTRVGSLAYTSNVEGMGVAVLGLLCCVLGMTALLVLLGVLAFTMRDGR